MVSLVIFFWKQLCCSVSVKKILYLHICLNLTIFQIITSTTLLSQVTIGGTDEYKVLGNQVLCIRVFWHIIVMWLRLLQRNSVDNNLYLHFSLNFTTKNQHQFTVKIFSECYLYMVDSGKDNGHAVFPICWYRMRRQKTSWETSDCK
jgi:hypothetical protein